MSFTNRKYRITKIITKLVLGAHTRTFLFGLVIFYFARYRLYLAIMASINIILYALMSYIYQLSPVAKYTS